MLAKRIIPCLDVTDGRVVKGVNFVELRDAGDPVELADVYNRDGADELVFLDITASSDHRETMVHVVEDTARKVFIPLTVGGGIRSIADARTILTVGADKVSINTAAVERPELITELSEEFGAQATVLAIDARRREPGAWNVFTYGGRKDTGMDAVEWARRGEELGGRRNPAHFDGLRWNPRGFRLRAHPHHLAQHPHPDHRQRRRRPPRGFRPRADRRRSRRGAGGLDFPLRDVHRG